MRVTAIIAAGGTGVRLGGERPKQLVEIGGRAILERSVSLFLDHASIDDVIVALPRELVDNPPSQYSWQGNLPGGTMIFWKIVMTKVPVISASAKAAAGTVSQPPSELNFAA